MAIVDASGDVENGYTYDVYGEPTVTGSLGNEFDFAGQQTDPSTGLQYLRARYYDPVSGTFMSRDLMSRTPAWALSNTAYAAANPIRFADPAGAWPGEGIAKKVGNNIADLAGKAKDAVVEKAKDPLIWLSVAQVASAIAAGAGCSSAVATGGALTPACVIAIGLVGYTITAKQRIIVDRYLNGQYNDAQFACMMVTSAPLPIPGVIPGFTVPLCPALGAIQDALLSSSDESKIGTKEKNQ